MGDYRVLRVGGIVAMVGAVLAVVFNLLHPRSGDTTLEAHLELVSSSGLWVFDHFAIFLLGGAFLFSLWAIARSFRIEPSRSWAGAALVFAIAGAALLVPLLAIDGFAGKVVADAWAESATDANLAAGRAVTVIEQSVFTSTVLLSFGLSPVLFGITILAGAEYPRGLGWLAIVSGVIGVVTATIQFLSGPSNLTLNVLFTISSLLLTVWLFVMGRHLYRRTGTEELMAPVEARVTA